MSYNYAEEELTGVRLMIIEEIGVTLGDLMEYFNTDIVNVINGKQKLSTVLLSELLCRLGHQRWHARFVVLVMSAMSSWRSIRAF